MKFTQRMKKLYDIYAPMQRIPKRRLAPGQNYVPPTKMLDPRIVITPDKVFDWRCHDLFLLNCGWGFTDKFAFDYAKRHSLELELEQKGRCDGQWLRLQVRLIAGPVGF